MAHTWQSLARELTQAPPLTLEERRARGANPKTPYPITLAERKALERTAKEFSRMDRVTRDLERLLTRHGYDREGIAVVSGAARDAFPGTLA